MSKESLAAALAKERTRLMGLDSVTQRGREAVAAIEVIQAELARFGKVRASAFQQAQKEFGSTYGDLAAMFGVTRQRAHEITRKVGAIPSGRTFQTRKRATLSE